MRDLGSALGLLAPTWCAAVGAAVGSFLNVVIARVPFGQSIVRPGSRCPACHAPIRWYDNIPLLSWLALRARCRHCGARISARYPLVEFLGAVAALVAFARHGLSLAAGAEFAFASALIALAFIDVTTWLLPNAITWPLIAFGVVMGALGTTPAGSFRSAVYGSGLGFAAFASLHLLGEKMLHREALGLGDVWLLSGVGAWLGPLALLPVVLFASLQGTCVGLALIALGRGEPGPPSSQRTQQEPSLASLPASGEGEGTPACAPAADMAEERETAAPLVEATWHPPRHAVPFGPFLVLGALEWLWLTAMLTRAVPVLRIFR